MPARPALNWIESQFVARWEGSSDDLIDWLAGNDDAIEARAVAERMGQVGKVAALTGGEIG